MLRCLFIWEFIEFNKKNINIEESMFDTNFPHLVSTCIYHSKEVECLPGSFV